MASVNRDPSGNFHVRFWFGGRQFRRSLKTKHQRKAEAAASHVEENIRLIEQGRLELPDDADVPTFLLSDGKIDRKPKPKKQIRLEQLLPRYLEQTPEGSLELSTQKLTAIHMRHFCRLLGDGCVLRSIDLAALQRYVTTRSKESGSRGFVAAETIRKDLRIRTEVLQDLRRRLSNDFE